MGACYCRPQTLVTEDPNVTMHTEVGFCVRMGQHQEDFMQLCTLGTGGLAYVKNTGHLCLESTIRSRLCCMWLRDEWRLRDITEVEVVTGSITVTRRDRYGTSHSTHRMNPGLQVTLKTGDRIAMEMPDAVNFCARLRQMCNLPTVNPAVQRVLEDLILGAIVNSRIRSAGATSAAPRTTTSAPRTLAPRTVAPPRMFTAHPGLQTTVPSKTEDSQPLLA